MRLLALKWKGLTLLEFLISVVIISALVIAAIPTYQHYSKKAYYSDLIQASFRYQTAVTQCLTTGKHKLAECNGGEHGIPANRTQGRRMVDSIIVKAGVITVTPKARHGITADQTYILTPQVTTEGVRWQVSGGGCHAGLVPNC